MSQVFDQANLTDRAISRARGLSHAVTVLANQVGLVSSDFSVNLAQRELIEAVEDLLAEISDLVDAERKEWRKLTGGAPDI